MRKSLMIVVAALATVAFGGSAAPALAGKTSSTPGVPIPCPFTNYEQPFYNWDDFEWYGVASGSTFPTSRTPSGWSLKNSKVVLGGNPFRPFSSDYSLQLGTGTLGTVSYAITPAFCVDQWSPFSRTFAVTTTENPDPAYPAKLKIELVYTDAATRATVTEQVGVLDPQGQWDATPRFPLITDEVSPKWDTNWRANVKYKFTPLNGSVWRIDDLFIDPKRH